MKVKYVLTTRDASSDNIYSANHSSMKRLQRIFAADSFESSSVKSNRFRPLSNGSEEER